MIATPAVCGIIEAVLLSILITSGLFVLSVSKSPSTEGGACPPTTAPINMWDASRLSIAGGYREAASCVDTQTLRERVGHSSITMTDPIGAIGVRVGFGPMTTLDLVVAPVMTAGNIVCTGSLRKAWGRITYSLDVGTARDLLEIFNCPNRSTNEHIANWIKDNRAELEACARTHGVAT